MPLILKGQGADTDHVETVGKHVCADKAIAAHQIVAAKIADELVSGDNRGSGILPVVEKHVPPLR
jgi:hypothetical protein